MDFALSPDQEALVSGIAQVCERRFDSAAVRAMIDGGLDRGRWSELADVGVFSLVRPESRGGIGLGWAEAVLVFEQLGRALVPGPLVATALAAASPSDIGDDQVIGCVEREPGAVLVENLPALDSLLVVDDDGLERVDPGGLVSEGVAHPLDPLTPVHRVAELPRGERVGDAADVALWRVRGSVLTAALQLGGARAATDLAVAYAKEREQFGRPIGSFQAIKHLCADMVSRAEVASAAVYMAGVALDSSDVAEPARAAATAWLLATEAADRNGRDCVQVHGGMGYTWEVDAHLYLKRAWVRATTFGREHLHAELMATYV